MLYLSRLILNLRHRGVQFDLTNCHGLHGRIMGAFPTAPAPASAREHFGVLYRLELLPAAWQARLLVQSEQPPDWSNLPSGYLGPAPDGRGNPAVRSIEAEIDRVQAQMQLRFRLRANPTKRISDRNATQAPEWQGKRIELRKEVDQLAWLERKASTGGFQLLRVQIGDDRMVDVQFGNGPKQHGRRSGGGQRLSFGTASFEGHLEVTDPLRFNATLRHGIGSGKAYGFGLLSVASIQEHTT
ncbi:MAG: type I-E CRISPR-associated protein Cas6/Cse3/CasE [Herpetosiphonaceae bacterium]|nr:type I-E CRISPR-associated protein Cas6/Cse3/CasE [Herpetosiphonaceae bacterium]